MTPDFESEAQASGAVSPAPGAGGGASQTAPTNLGLGCVLRRRLAELKEMFYPKYERFYPINWLTWYSPPKNVLVECAGDRELASKLSRELIAMSEIFEVEGRDTWTTLMEVIVNGVADPIEEKDYKAAVAHLRRLNQLSEREARQRWVREIVTKSGKKIYAKRADNKLVVWGDTYHVKETLKKLKFHWDPVKRVWYAPASVDVNSVVAKLAEV
jgi:hypothetical protein